MISASHLWGKAKPTTDDRPQYQPLSYHCLDVAACADAILMREPEATRARMAAILGLEWDEARAWLLLVVACHDLGKACPGFQAKWPILLDQTGLSLPRSPNTEINHAFVSQITLAKLLREKGWSDELADLTADAVGCHHGSRAPPTTLDHLAGATSAIGKDDWAQARKDLVDAFGEVFRPTRTPTNRR
ncbi:CRISPR-associated endonuclease Cas3'' [Propionivibrio sp.]|uniref:CRISPR-associated endonuclease Cas3'' n=1 Tax=Propionivibrio sp. TaxID=2212460 RepID=UPI0025E87FD2|nr:CRISPR-associated endonuclease Cas3'' [Propionivibrio sp.]